MFFLLLALSLDSCVVKGGDEVLFTRCHSSSATFPDEGDTEGSSPYSGHTEEERRSLAQQSAVSPMHAHKRHH